MSDEDWQQMVDGVYSQRNELAIAFVKTALIAGWNAGVGVDPKMPDTWSNVVYVDLPNGKQVSWHIGPADSHLLKDLPAYKGQWDQTFLGRTIGWSSNIEVMK